MNLSHLENPASCLETKLHSLAKIVLQNQRKLDLLVMRQEGQYATGGNLLFLHQ